MAFAEDLTQFFDTRDFAEVATLHLTGSVTRAINAIFNHPSQEVTVYDTAVEADSPNMQCLKTDVAGLARGTTVDVGGGTHKVVRVGDDGTGLVTVYFE
ncbi:MAG TPA: hypothetical protein VHU19_14255 [Pyrinomonadaceae bacterium]|jgi:hypothetical protein|nr:hypothetical protein [Pyrinomonadaceae bacterium]